MRTKLDFEVTNSSLFYKGIVVFMLVTQGTQVGQIKMAKVEKLRKKRAINIMHGKVPRWSQKQKRLRRKKINWKRFRPFSPESELNLLVNGNRFFISKNEHFFKQCPVLFSSLFICLFIYLFVLLQNSENCKYTGKLTCKMTYLPFKLYYPCCC